MNKLRRARVGILPQPLLRKIIMRHARGPQNAARCHSRCCGAKLLIRRALPPEKKWLRRARHSRCCAAPFLTRRARPARKTACDAPLWGNLPQSQLWGKISHTARAPQKETGPQKLGAARSARRYWQKLSRGTPENGARLALGGKSPQLMPSWKFSQARHHPCPHTYAPRQFHLPRNECQ